MNSVRPSDFMARLAPEDRAGLLALAHRRTVERGALVYSAGLPGDNVYFLEAGQIKIYHLSPTGKEVLLWFCLSGEIFGLTEICRGGERQVHAQACERSSVYSVARNDFKAFLSARPQAALLVIDVLSCRLRGLGNVIQDLVASEVTERVLQLIQRLGAVYGRREGEALCLDLHITHQEMANMIGSTRQSVTSALSALRRMGVLDLEGRRIRIRNEQALRQAGFAAVRPETVKPGVH
jgi:CRP/FNR family transcriptional regulator